MPVGPSHSRGASGGGRGIGGGRSGGMAGPPRRSSPPPRAHGGIGLGAPHPAPHPVGHRHRRTFMFFGRPLVITSGIITALALMVVMFIGSLIFSISSISGVVSLSKTVNIYKSDAEVYEEIISKAKAGEDGYYLATATFNTTFNRSYNSSNPRTGAYEYVYIDGITYYYIVFEYENEVTNTTMTGETYTQFSSSQFTGLGGEMEVAYAYIDGSWSVINTSYSLDVNQDYQELLNSLSSKRTTAIISTILAVVFVLVVVLVIVNAFKKSKREQEAQEAKTRAEIAEAEAKAQEAVETAKNKNRKCAYCGAPVPDGATRCPNCGSTNFTKK